MVDDSMLAWIEEHVLVPTVHTMKRNRKPFKVCALRRTDADASRP